MIIKCEKHGESEVTPNANGDTHCPKCLSAAIQRFNNYSMGCSVQGSACKLCEPETKLSQYEDILLGLKRAGLIDSCKMTGEDTAEVKILPVPNWLNKIGWSRLVPD